MQSIDIKPTPLGSIDPPRIPHVNTPRTPIPRVNPIRHNFSYEDFLAHCQLVRNPNVIRDVELQKLVLQVIGRTRGQWTRNLKFKEEDFNRIAYSVYQRNGDYITGRQVGTIFKNAKLEMRKWIQKCVKANLDEQQTREKLGEWQLYSSFSYFRTTFSQFEKEKRAEMRGEEEVILVDEEANRSINQSFGTIGNGNVKMEMMGHEMTFMQDPSSTAGPSIPAPTQPTNPEMAFIMQRLDAFSENPVKHKLVTNAIVKLLMTAEEEEFTTTRQLFEKMM